jgi:hypothetical protein
MKISECVIPELALPKISLDFGSKASSGIQRRKNYWIPDEVALPKMKAFLEAANSGMTRT